MKMVEPKAFRFMGQDWGRICFNGKFLSAGPTGVHRVAEELIRAFETLLVEQASSAEVEIKAPRGVRPPEDVKLSLRRGWMTWIPWEQLELPARASGSMLINLCNLGPVLSRRAITMIHDAQVFLSPDSYPRGFRAWYHFCLPLLGKRHREILTVSEFSKRELTRFGVAWPNRITVIHNGVDHIMRIEADHGVIDRLGLVPRRYACAQANTQKHKNIGLALSAFTFPETMDLTLVLVGGSNRQDFEAAGLVVPDNVVFAGQVSDAELRALMENALCYLCPSTTEGFGLPPMESMALGTPAIVAPEGALPEVCGAAAIYAPLGQPAIWAQWIEKLQRERGYWQLRSGLAREHAARFTWRKAAQELMAVLDLVHRRERGEHED